MFLKKQPPPLAKPWTRTKSTPPVASPFTVTLCTTSSGLDVTGVSCATHFRPCVAGGEGGSGRVTSRREEETH